ncbi:uncharacterized protein BJX67DRAFT_344421 [Aspergillus lucknowensis]|uniref:Uncharacterized protein n=1 Tax=Aspergillus lucknowensis TaxID=176173 RepID=A0ABR4M257_9EURO
MITDSPTSYNALLTETNPGSRALLTLWACFDYSSIRWGFIAPLHFMSEYELGSFSDLAAVTASEAAFDEALQDLELKKLVKRRDIGVYQMPDEVAQYIQSSLSESQRAELGFLVVTMFGLHAERSHPDQHSQRGLPGNEIISHLQSFCKLLSGEALEDNEAGNTEVALLGLSQIGELLSRANDLVQAEKFYLKAIRGSECLLGPQNRQYLERCFSLGTLYYDLRRLPQAEEFLLTAARGYEATSGSDDTKTQDAFDFLAMTYRDLERVQDAVDIHIRMVERRTAILGPENIDTLVSLHRLGMAYKAQGELQRAEETIRKTWQGFCKVLGPRHHATLSIMADLGKITSERGELVPAEESCNQAHQG